MLSMIKLLRLQHFIEVLVQRGLAAMEMLADSLPLHAQKFSGNQHY